MLSRFVCACFLVISMVFCSAVAYAGKMELTTYYPAPYGEYRQLKSQGVDASNGAAALQAGGSTGTGLVVTNANRVGIGIAPPEATLDVAGEVKVGNTGAVCSPENNGAL